MLLTNDTQTVEQSNAISFYKAEKFLVASLNLW